MNDKVMNEENFEIVQRFAFTFSTKIPDFTRDCVKRESKKFHKPIDSHPESYPRIVNFFY